MYLKGMFGQISKYRLGSTSFQVHKKPKELSTDKLMSSNLKIVFRSLIKVKSFLPFTSRISYLRCCFQDLFVNTRVMLAKRAITVRPKF